MPKSIKNNAENLATKCNMLVVSDMCFLGEFC